MPQLGETVTEGTITKWHKRVGDAVAEDEVLFEVSTDKVDSEVPSPVSGTVEEILVQEGETVSVGTKLAVIGRGGEAPGDGAGQQAAPASAPEANDDAGGAVDVRDDDDEPAADGAEVTVGAGSEPAASSRRPGGQAAQAKPPTGAPPRPGSRPADQRPPSAPAQGGPSKLLSPVVRRLIAEHGLDPAEIVGSGAGGRITRDDVLAAIDRQGPNGAGPATEEASDEAPRRAGPAPSTTQAGPVPTAGERDRVVPFTNIRRRTAEHMVRSKHTSAHTMVAVEVD
jgi:pyruvate dehydrogenase E2 component (dihydrolipoamide acetyltransferase)